MSFILVMYIYAGTFARGDSVTITHIPNFQSRAACESAGKQSEKLVNGSAKEYRFVCLESK